MNRVEALFDRLWSQYAGANPQARKIRELLAGHGETVVNDHVAFRTFNLEKVNIDKVARRFTDLGYQSKESYVFEEKRLDARHFEHPSGQYPLVFISELRIGEFSDFLQKTITQLVDALPRGVVDSTDFVVSGVRWPVISFQTYEALRKESEYAAWTATFGYRANHFTVSVNELKDFSDLQSLNTFLKEHGFRLNDAGGEIKGSPQVWLEQSSTLADEADVQFADCRRSIPCCYYEFAKRYALPDGSLFKGFVAQSANKIFESTDKSD